MSKARQSSEPSLCIGGCMFFGNPATEGYCSKCYREKQSTEAGDAPSVSSSTSEVASVESAPKFPTSSDVCPPTLPEKEKPAVPMEGIHIDTNPTEVRNNDTTVDDSSAPPSKLVATSPSFVPEKSRQIEPLDVDVSPVTPVPKETVKSDEMCVDEKAPKVVDTTDKPTVEKKRKKKKKNRCKVCRKKLTLTAIKCRCDFFFCSQHRYPDSHECTFDYRSMQNTNLSKANPVCAPKQLQSI